MIIQFNTYIVEAQGKCRKSRDAFVSHHVTYLSLITVRVKQWIVGVRSVLHILDGRRIMTALGSTLMLRSSPPPISVVLHLLTRRH